METPEEFSAKSQQLFISSLPPFIPQSPSLCQPHMPFLLLTPPYILILPFFLSSFFPLIPHPSLRLCSFFPSLSLSSSVFVLFSISLPSHHSTIFLSFYIFFTQSLRVTVSRAVKGPCTPDPHRYAHAQAHTVNTHIYLCAVLVRILNSMSYDSD